MMEVKSIRHNMIMNILLSASGVVIPLLTYPYITRVLSPDGLGRVSFATSLIFYFKIIAQLGIPTYGIKLCAQNRENQKELSKTVINLAAINICSMFLSVVIFLSAVFHIQSLEAYREVLLIAGINILAETMNFEWLFKGLEQFDYITKRSLLCRILVMILTFLVIREENDYLMYAFLTTVSPMIICILNIRKTRKIIRFDLKKIDSFYIRSWMKPILTLCLTGTIVTIYTSIDTVMISYFCGDALTGIYSVAIKVKTILVTLLTSAAAVYLPRLSICQKENNMNSFTELISRSLKFIFMTALPMAIFFFCMADMSVHIIAGEGYETAILPMKILMPTILIIGITSILGTQALISLGKQIPYFIGAMIAAVVDVILNLLLIPEMGICGAAISTLAAEVIVLISDICFLHDMMPDILKKVNVLKIVIGSFCSAIVLIMLRNCSTLRAGNELVYLIECFVVYVFAYGGLLFLFKESMFMECLQIIMNQFKRKG